MGVDGIIGYSGFVGANLVQQHDFSGLFNSRNIDDSANAKFEILVCAAAPGSMFQANNSPERDLAQIELLCQKLSHIEAKHFVLISSIAVLADFAGKDSETTNAFQADLAYGRHRRLLEKFCAQHFASTLIVRLPALFGHNLKKNFIFDILNPVPSMLDNAKMIQAFEMASARDCAVLKNVYKLNVENGLFVLDRPALYRSPALARIENDFAQNGITAVQFTHRDSTFQYYNLDCLWADIEAALANGIDVLHLATEPLIAAQIYNTVTGRDMPETLARLHHEDMRTLHARLRNRSGPYLADAGQILEQIVAFAKRQRDVKA